jgi:hypothetical protein
VPICELANESSLLPKSRGELSREVLRARVQISTLAARYGALVLVISGVVRARPRKGFYLGR